MIFAVVAGAVNYQTYLEELCATQANCLNIHISQGYAEQSITKQYNIEI